MCQLAGGVCRLFFKRVTPQPIAPRVKAPMVAILAEGDLVVLVLVREAAKPDDTAQKYTTTWFDMFRLEGARLPSTGTQQPGRRDRMAPHRDGRTITGSRPATN